MTKRVRVENADSGMTFTVIVQVWEKGRQEGPAEGERAPDTMISEVTLYSPCQLTGDDVYLTDSRYIVIKEGKNK